MSPYEPPVASLITYGPAGAPSTWPDYVKEFHFTRRHVPELVRMVDEQAVNKVPDNVAESAAPVHAWRALAQLGAPEALAPMIRLIETDTSLLAPLEIEKVASMIGASGVEPLGEILADRTREDHARAAAADGLAAIATQHQKVRSRIIKLLVEPLGHLRRNSFDLNTALVHALVHMRAREAYAAIEAAFQQQQVDPQVLTWDDVEATLGPPSS